ncbi:hypothetical protein ACIKP9_12710 [Methylobacillus methanolivorans]|uniref:YtkA-like domain-containing protein n=1 Tax=Methylobacillus methanolivorans TaxID=1848927 RepID=A0ABW8GST0_9PROT
MSFKRPLRWGIVLLLILGSLGYFWLKSNHDAIETIVCDAIVQGCTHGDLTVRAMTPPTTMQAFEVRISSPGAESVHASFDMVDMQMGMNRYRFQRQPDGSWRAMVTLPLCVSGRSDWIMLIDIKHSSQALPAHYQLTLTTQ